VAELREAGDHVVSRPDARAVNCERLANSERVSRPDARAVAERLEAGEHDARARWPSGARPATKLSRLPSAIFVLRPGGNVADATGPAACSDRSGDAPEHARVAPCLFRLTRGEAAGGDWPRHRQR